MYVSMSVCLSVCHSQSSLIRLNTLMYPRAVTPYQHLSYSTKSVCNRCLKIGQNYSYRSNNMDGYDLVGCLPVLGQYSLGNFHFSLHPNPYSTRVPSTPTLR